MRIVAGIGIAGALGAVARYGLDGIVSRRTPGAFPWGTFVVNVTGAFVLGLLFAVLTEHLRLSAWLRQSMTVGFLGAYTTFSTLSLETVRLVEDGSIGVAAAYALGSLVAGLAATWAGLAVGRAI